MSDHWLFSGMEGVCRGGGVDAYYASWYVYKQYRLRGLGGGGRFFRLCDVYLSRAKSNYLHLCT